MTTTTTKVAIGRHDTPPWRCDAPAKRRRHGPKVLSEDHEPNTTATTPELSLSSTTTAPSASPPPPDTNRDVTDEQGVTALPPTTPSRLVSPAMTTQAAEELAVQVVAMARVAHEVSESDKEFKVVSLAPHAERVSGDPDDDATVDASELERLLNVDGWRVEHAVQTTRVVGRGLLVPTPTFVLSRHKTQQAPGDESYNRYHHDVDHDDDDDDA